MTENEATPILLTLTLSGLETVKVIMQFSLVTKNKTIIDFEIKECNPTISKLNEYVCRKNIATIRKGTWM